MTKERTQEVIVIAFALSLAIHIGTMLYAKHRVMTRVADGYERKERRTMRVTKASAKPEKEIKKVLEDLAPLKDAPKVENAAKEVRGAELKSAALSMPELGKVVAPSTPPSDLKLSVNKPVFEAKAVAAVDNTLKPLTPEKKTLSPIKEPSISPIVPKIERSLGEVASFKPPEIAISAPQLEKAERLPSPIDTAQSFTPSMEVYDRVDERIIAGEKAAVSALLNQENYLALENLVDVKSESEEEGEWKYWTLTISPRRELKKMPKDFVILIDASGSIGKDRIGSIRKATKRLLRSAANTGDRFNLVAFRDDFTYAFKRWQDCNADSFEFADDWLNRLTPFGRTDVFSTISSVLKLPRDPKRPLIALVVTDGDANEGVSENSEILGKFTTLNGGLISVYMYGVRGSANRELIDVLTHGNRGESFIFDGFGWSAGSGIETLSERFRDPALSDLKLVYSADCAAESYPKTLKNLYFGDTLVLTGRVPKSAKELSFSLSGLNRGEAYESFFRVPLKPCNAGGAIKSRYINEENISIL